MIDSLHGPIQVVLTVGASLESVLGIYEPSETSELVKSIVFVVITATKLVYIDS